MQRLQGWVRYAAEGLTQKAGAQQQQQVDSCDEEDFIYARVHVQSDDEDAGPVRRNSSRRISAPTFSTPVSNPGSPRALPHQHDQQQQQQHAQLPAVQLMHMHSHSDGELLHLESSGQHQLRHQQQQAGGIDDLLHPTNNTVSNAPSDPANVDSSGPGWEADWDHEFAGSSNHTGTSILEQQQQQQQQGHRKPPAGPSRNSSNHVQQQQQQQQQQQEGINSDSRTTVAAAAAVAEPTNSGDSSSRSTSAEGPEDSNADESVEIPDHEHSYKRRELIIYAVPLTRGKVIFLPVCPWRTEPEQHKGLKKALAGHVGKVQGEASDLWQRMSTAEQGTLVNRVYKLGKRVLDSISPEERLMRGVPKDISKVIIHHPSQVSPEMIMEQMQTMTKSYGIKAVGKAAAATLMLPLAVGVDLIILPGPQVLTYYTMWELYRNTNGALGTTRMTKFITQGGSSENIRVNYIAENRLDKYYDLANDCPEGVLSEDDIEHLVNDLREPDLAEALLSLRNKALREAGKRTSKGGDEYVALPPTDPAVVDGFGSVAAAGGASSSEGSGLGSRRTSTGW